MLRFLVNTKAGELEAGVGAMILVGETVDSVDMSCVRGENEDDEPLDPPQRLAHVNDAAKERSERTAVSVLGFAVDPSFHERNL